MNGRASARDPPVQALHRVQALLGRGRVLPDLLDGVLEHSPAEHVRRPVVPAESPTLRFALQSAAARQALQEAQRAGVPLTVYQNRRFDADLLTVRAVIDSGEVGRVTRFESRIEQYTLPGAIPSSGGGILLDLGAQIADQALLLFGPVMSVSAELDDAGGRPGRFFIALRHAGVWSHTWQAISYCTARRAPGSGCPAPSPATTLTHSTAGPAS
jgi:hypothetical protein